MSSKSSLIWVTMLKTKKKIQSHYILHLLQIGFWPKKFSPIIFWFYILRSLHIYIEHRISKHEKRLRLLSSGTKLFITFEFKGSSTSGERYTFFLFGLFHLPPPPISCGTRHKGHWPGFGEQAKANRLLPRQVSTRLTDFFKISQNPLRASGTWRHSHLLAPFPISGYCHISEWHVRFARAWTAELMLHLSNPCTEPKGSRAN